MNTNALTLNDMLQAESIEQMQRLKDAGVDTTSFSILVHRNYSGDIEISYNIGSYGDVDQVKGRDLYDIVTEYMRRKGWTEANKPMKLIGSSKQEEFPPVAPPSVDDIQY